MTITNYQLSQKSKKKKTNDKFKPEQHEPKEKIGPGHAFLLVHNVLVLNCEITAKESHGTGVMAIFRTYFSVIAVCNTLKI